MVRFYDAMIHSVKARKLYVQVVLILLLLFHYVYISGHVGEFGVFLSTAICATIYSFRRADRLLRGLYTTAVTAAYLLLAALFYPSVRVMTEFQDIGIISEWMKFPRLLAESYYDHHHAILPQDADSGNTDISAQ